MKAALPGGDPYPSATLDNGVVRALVYLPDARRGYYQGVRFDASGIVAQATVGGHTFFGALRTPHHPQCPDSVAGPVEEFGMNDPLGYDEARPGESFIKIGVGLLRKVSDQAYFFNGAYPLVRAPAWRVTRTLDSLRFRQDLADERGWGYTYVKRVRLPAGRPELRIDHELRNTGARAIATDHYSHNMIRFDDRPIGRGYRIEFPFVPQGIPKPGQASIEGRAVVFRPATLAGAMFMPMAGWAGAEDNAATIRHDELGLALRVATPVAPCRYNFYAEAPVICPEPFIPIRLQPGESTAWTTVIAFEVAG